MAFPSGSDGKESSYNVGDPGGSLGWEEPLEKGKATHSSILAWGIPWAEEPHGLQSMLLQRVRDKQLTLMSPEETPFFSHLKGRRVCCHGFLSFTIHHLQLLTNIDLIQVFGIKFLL